MSKKSEMAMELQLFAAGTRTLAELSKDTLIELHRECFGNVGDTARTPKADYVSRILDCQMHTGELADKAADRLSAQDQQPEQPKQQPTPAKPFPKPQPLDLLEPSTMAKPEQPAAPVVPQQAADQLTALIASIAQANAPKAQTIDADAVKSIIREELGSLKPLQIVINGIEQPEIKAEHRHPMFEKVLKLCAAGQNVLMVGPAGTGKTHMAGQVADALNRSYGALHCTAGASESQLTGWLLPTGQNGTFEYAPAPFVSLYEAGNSLFLLDEIDAADPNMLMCINGALANGHLHIPHRLTNPTAKRGDGCAIIAAANTFGTGADFLYSGRNQLDAATLDRFYTVWIDYDREYERSQLADGELLAWIWSVREKAAAAKLRRVISTRAIQKAATAQAIGFDADEIKRDLLQGWTRDELAKVGA